MSRATKTVLTLFAVGVLWLVSDLVPGSSPLVTTAHAESVRTTKRARVMSRPGQRARVLARVPAGKTLTVLARRGRWIKVKHQGKTGWITRSSTSPTSSARKTVRNNRRRPYVKGREKRRSDSKSSKSRSSSRASKKKRSKKKRVASRSKKKTRREESRSHSKRKREIELDDDEVLIDEEDIDEESEPAPRRREERARDEDELDEEAVVEEKEEDPIDDLIDGIRNEKKEKPRRSRRRSRDDDRDEYSSGDDDGGEDESGEEEEEKGPQKVKIRVAEAGMRGEPSEDSEEVRFYDKGAELTVIRKSESGKWILVEDDKGDSGWILASDTATQGYQHPKYTARAVAAVGYTSVGSAFASNGTGELANYQYSSAAASVAVAGELILKLSDTYLFAVDGGYTGTRATPGIRYMNSEGQTTDIGFTMHDLGAGASLGYNLKSAAGTTLYGRIGYHLGRFDIHDVDNFEVNLAMLPSEVLKGMTVGAHIDVPHFTDKVAMRLGGDLLYPNGVREQYAGLEDGAVSQTMVAWALGRVSYCWKPSLVIELRYRFTYGKTSWSGEATDSMRPHHATEANRTDMAHTVMLGVGKRL